MRPVMAIGLAFAACFAYGADLQMENKKAVLEAFARLARVSSYRLETQGQVGTSHIDSRIDAQFPDRFHILNRLPENNEMIVTPEGSFTKNGDTPWISVPITVASIAASLGPVASQKMLESIRSVEALGKGRCPVGAARKFRFVVTSMGEAKQDVRTTVLIAEADGLPCEVRAQQKESNIDTTARYDFVSEFKISAPN